MYRRGETGLYRRGIAVTTDPNRTPSPTPAAAEPLVRHGSKLTYEELCEEAHRLAKGSSLTYEEIADRLDVATVSVSKAVTQPGPKFQRLQMRIIEALSEYEVERREHVEFRTWRKDRSERSP